MEQPLRQNLIKFIYMKKINNAFTLIELSIVLAIVGVMAASLITNQLEQLQVKLAQVTAEEVRIIQQAAMKYYVDKSGNWPNVTGNLTNEGYLNPNWDENNKFGNGYVLASSDKNLTVSTQVPVKYAYVFNQSLSQISWSGNTLTSQIPPPGSEIAINNAVPMGEIILWDEMKCVANGGVTPCGADNCPVRFSPITGFDDRFLVINSTSYGDVGGNATHRHGAGTYVSLGHVHYADGTDMYVPSHSHSGRTDTASAQGSGKWTYEDVQRTSEHRHDLDIDGSGPLYVRGHTQYSDPLNITGVSGDVVEGDSRPPYVTVILCQKDI